MAVNDTNISTVNINGVKRKFHVLKNFINTDNIHILSLTETRTQHKIKIPRFHTFQHFSSLPHSRGTALLISSKIPASPHTLPPNLLHLESIAANTLINNTNTVIISYYNPPNEPISQDLFEYANTLPHVIILGDFNARNTDFGDRISNPNGTLLTNFLTNFQLYRIPNKNPTFINYHGHSIIDHIIISENLIPKFSDLCHIGTTVTSDHLPLTAKILTHTNLTQNSTRTIYDTKNADWKQYKTFITNHFHSPDITNDTTIIDEQIQHLTDVITEAKNTAIPVKQIPQHRRPLPPSILSLIKQKRQVYRQIKTNPDPSLKTTFNRLNAQIRRDINLFREADWQNTCESLNYRHGKQFWSKFKLITGQKSQTRQHLSVNNVFLTSPQEIANCFADTLQKTHQIPQDPNFSPQFFDNTIQEVQNFLNEPVPQVPDPRVDDHLTDNITSEEVSNIIQNLKNTKSPGPDQIKPILLKNLPSKACKGITTIFNNCLSSAYFPTAWKHAETIMIPKPGKNLSDPASYRPISLLNIIGKIFERIISDRLRFHLESNNLLPPEQFGFRSQRSTANPILELHTDTVRHTNLKECTIAVFLDIERAFDKVWHDGLIKKLLDMNLNPLLTKLLYSFLSQRTCNIRHFTTQSHTVHLHAGVPQGSVLSPLLYIIYCRDFPIADNDRNKTRLFADDTTLWSSHHQAEHAATHVQQQLHRIETWTNNWRVKPNPTKSHCMLITYPKSKQFYVFQRTNLTLNNKPIPKARSVQYLGITFSPNPNLQLDIKNTLRKARSRANLLKLVRGTIRGCNTDTLIHTYKTFIRPIIEYRAPIYASLSSNLLKPILSFERNLLRMIFKLENTFPSNLIHKHANITPISERLTKLQQNYITRTLTSENQIAINNLHTSFKLPTKNGLKNRIPKAPHHKLKHVTTALLTSKYPDLPPTLQELVEETPICMR